MGDASGDKLVCRCYRVPVEVVRKVVRERGLRQVEEITALTHAGGGCSSCWDDLQEILSDVWGKPRPRDAPDASGLSSSQKRDLIGKMIESDVQPILDLNGLQLQLVDVAEDRVLVRFTGDAVGTPAPSFLALKRHLVRRMTEACGHRMQLIELNVLEQEARSTPPR